MNDTKVQLRRLGLGAVMMLFLAGGLGLAQSGAFEFTSPEAKRAKAKYDFAIQAAAKKRDRSIKQAAKQYEQTEQGARATLLRELNEAKDAATKAAQLDEAVRIRDAIEALRKDKEILTPPAPDIPAVAVEFDGHHYLAVLNRMTLEQARAKCKEMGGELASLESQREFQFVSALIDDVACWVGATDAEVEGEWRWVSGAAVHDSFWSKGQPNGGQDQDAALLNAGRLFDVPSSGKGADNLRGFVCEWKTQR